MFPRSRFFNQKLYHIRCSLKTRAFIKASLLYVQKTLKALPYTKWKCVSLFVWIWFRFFWHSSVFVIWHTLGTVPSLGLGWSIKAICHSFSRFLWFYFMYEMNVRIAHFYQVHFILAEFLTYRHVKLCGKQDLDKKILVLEKSFKKRSPICMNHVLCLVLTHLWSLIRKIIQLYNGHIHIWVPVRVI